MTIPSLLPSLFVLDVADDVLDFRIRLAGTAVEAAYGELVTGKRLRDIDLGLRGLPESLSKDYRVVARDGVAALSRQTFWVETSGPFTHERLLLPFATTKPGVVSQIIGGFFFDPKYKGLTWKGAISRWQEDASELFPLESTVSQPMTVVCASS